MIGSRTRRPTGKTLFRSVCLGVFAICTLLGATSGTQDAVANGDTRTIDVMQMHTKERISVTFRRNGRYDQRGLEQLNWIMRDWRRDEATKMNPRLYDLLWEVHRSTGSREPVRVVSAYRSPQTNAALRRRSSAVAQTSQHMSGNAVDFYLADVPADRIRAIGMRMQRGGVGYYPRANTPFIHLDVASVRHWPRMSRQQLVNMFPDQRTAHIPTDGKPLARFEEARREILAAGGTVMGETGTAVAQQGTGRRSLWAALFGGGDESDEDVAEANSLDSSGWVNPAAFRSPSPPPASAPTAVASAPPPQPAPARVAPQAASRQASASPLAIEPPRPPATVSTAATPLPALPLPVARPRQLGSQIATAAPVTVVPSEPQLVWQQGPAGRAVEETAERDTQRVVAYVPLPPQRPATEKSIETLVTAFASSAADARRDPLSQLGIDPPVGLRGAVAPGSAPGAFVPVILPPRRPVMAAASAPQAIASAIPAERIVPSTTATTRPRTVSGNAIAIARDEGAALRSLFSSNKTADTPAAPARIAVARVRRAEVAPSGFVAAGRSGLAQGFSKDRASDISSSAFAGPAVRPLQVRP